VTSTGLTKMSIASAATACFGALSACLPMFSLYYRTCDVSYRVPLRGKQLLDFKNESLFEGKYKFPHVGYRPELAPPLDGWGCCPACSRQNVRPFPAGDGKNVLQEFCCDAKDEKGKALPAAKARGVVILLVGLGDSVEKNGHVAAYLASKGFAVHGIDYPGYGQSQRDANMGSNYLPGMVSDWGTDVCGAVVRWASQVKARYPESMKMFVVGPSIGGSTALRACIEAPEVFDGAVLLCPAIQHEGLAVLKFLAPIIAFLFPRLPVGAIGDDDIGSKNLANAERITQDRWRFNQPPFARTVRPQQLGLPWSCTARDLCIRRKLVV
jgi:pimeloyl-ACP methyl ester carboxylesterase